MKKKKNNFTMTVFGVRVKQCCASCVWKDATRLMTKRYCTKQRKAVSPSGCCKHWAMNRQMMEVRKSEDRIKRREYQLYLLKIREEEVLNGVMEERPIEDIRAEFESLYGDIYWN